MLLAHFGLALCKTNFFTFQHFLAPRAATQDAMNLIFQGAEYELAERYTGMSVVSFTSFCSFSIF